jgi:dienelactone hydrolase
VTVTPATDREVAFAAADGWTIGGLLRLPADDSSRPAPAAVLVPGSRHERDAYTTLVDALAERGVGSLRIDVRGRGSSRGARSYARMAPRQRQRVSLDAAAALDHLVSHPAVDATRIGFVGEQDTAADALAGLASDDRLRAVVVLSARRGVRLEEGVAQRAVLGLVSSEDRAGLRGTVDAYLAGAPATSRLAVFRGLGFGTTMFSTRQFEHAEAEPLEVMIASWLAERLR